MSGSGISWAICKSASRSRQITMPVLHHSKFLQTGCPSCRPTNSVEALKAKHKAQNEYEIGAWSYTVAVARHEIAEADTDESDGAVVGGFPVRPLFDLHEDRARHEHEQARARHRDYHDPVHTSTYVYFSKPE